MFISTWLASRITPVSATKTEEGERIFNQAVSSDMLATKLGVMFVPKISFWLPASAPPPKCTISCQEYSHDYRQSKFHVRARKKGWLWIDLMRILYWGMSRNLPGTREKKKTIFVLNHCRNDVLICSGMEASVGSIRLAFVIQLMKFVSTFLWSRVASHLDSWQTDHMYIRWLAKFHNPCSGILVTDLY